MSNYLLVSQSDKNRLNLTPESFYTLSKTRLLAEKINTSQQEVTSPAELYALSLIADIMDYINTRYIDSQGPKLIQELMDEWQKKLSVVEQDELYALLSTFLPVGEAKERKSLDGRLLLRLWSNYLLAHNPAAGVFAKQFFAPLFLKSIALKKTVRTIEAYLARQAAEAFSGLTLPLLFRSAEGCGSFYEQLLFIVKNWGLEHTPFEARILVGLDLYKEEAKWFSAENFKSGPQPIPDYASDIYSEPEAFSQDLNWMPHLVLIAKNAYVWLDQLSRFYKQDIHQLDQIPEQELNRLANFGFNGLWLIGLWERSAASQKIKRINGNPEAVASAYALKSYEIAEDLGGWPAFHNLKERAWKRGIRLASDMVPNHMGVDSDWVVQHPDWFLSRPDMPYPNHRFNGQDLCDWPDVGIFIEDGYWRKSDASVVFKRVDYKNNDVRYIYHGNDGTGMPWNDTAQLDYLLPEVREAVIQTILHVARNFPVIRFDAAMTLAKKHYQRLWFPRPGTGGDIPTRSEYALSDEEFNKAFPVEFWRELVDRIQIEAPDTLLLAEAFWMMEGYFVRTLGMHRVYNSAFMNMLKTEANGEYREMVVNVLKFNPQILKRYVNFMNNPDEDTAVAQFGKDDKYFGVCTLMCTMPGLPMFGHGQIEGFTERYGMEYRRAYKNEQVDTVLRDRHLRQITGLLKNRPLYSEVDNFVFYDFNDGNGDLLPDVFCYSNRFADQRALIIYHNKFATASGWVQQSVLFKDAAGNDCQLSLTEGLKLSPEPNSFTIFKDYIDGLEYLKSNLELHNNGFFAEMHAYGLYVFSDIREVFDSMETPWAKLHKKLKGAPCISMKDALWNLVLKPVHTALKDILEILDPKMTVAFFQNDSTACKRIDTAFKHAAKDIVAYDGRSFDLDSEQLTAFFSSVNLSLTSRMAGNIREFLTDELLSPSNLAVDNRRRILFISFIKMLLPKDTPEALLGQLNQWRVSGFLKEYFGDDLLVETIMLMAGYAEPLWADGHLHLDKSTSPALMDYVGRFLQINIYENVRYFNRERWHELLDVGLLCFIVFDQRTINLRQKKKSWNDALKRNSRLKITAEKVGYDFVRLLEKMESI